MKFTVLKGTNLNTTVYRGYASIKDITAVSAPDTFNQDENPEGLQRDLSNKHARDAYRYAEGSQVVPDYLRLWPEVVVNVRDTQVVSLTPLDQARDLWEIEIHEDRLDRTLLRPQLSRTDGNHRLFYGAGNEGEGWPPLDISTPFCLTIGLSPEQETSLFMDINDNQKAMNTSHLAHLRSRLTEGERLQRDDPALWIAQQLVDDPKSPFHGIIYLGGERLQGLDRRVNLAALGTGVQMILKESIKLRAFDDVEPKYALIRIYWDAVSKAFPQEWADQRRYLLLRGFGVWSMSILGAEIIDRCITRRIFDHIQLEEEMRAYLRQARMAVDWDATEGNTRGYGGRVGARNLAELMKRPLSDEEVDLGRFAQSLTRTL